MFTEPLKDPTAGHTARAARVHREVPEPIRDPTDPRHRPAEVTAHPEAAAHPDAAEEESGRVGESPPPGRI